MATMQLAKWAGNVHWKSLPSSVQHATLRSTYNWIGCAIGGSFRKQVQDTALAHRSIDGAATGQSTLLGLWALSNKADMFTAALVNGMASHIHDYDDTHLATIIHPTGPVASAALAYAETDPEISGPRLLQAITAGIEASCKLGLAVWPEHYDIGWHITSTTGSIGAAVAVGRLMNLETETLAHAIGLASVHVIGLREMFGSDAKAYHVGAAAMAGLRAARLAQIGLTSSTSALEAKRGWANVVAGGGKPQLDKYILELGSIWEIERNAFKPFPCGIVCHPAIDACIQLHHDLQSEGSSISFDQFTSIQLRVHPLVKELTAKQRPKDTLEAKFSVYHGAAAGLIWGSVGDLEYEQKAVELPEVRHLRDLMKLEVDGSLNSDECYVQIVLKDGSKLTKHIKHAIGSLETPMTDEQLEKKFLDQASRVVGEKAAQITSKKCWDLANNPVGISL